MTRAIAFVLATCFSVLVGACGDSHDGALSSGAKGMPGALGTFEFKPDDWQEGKVTYWKDTDGVKPGEAGCHIGTDKDGNPNNRSFGEACLTDVVLVESNPGADVIHKHDNDTGHPDKFDCDVWCKGGGSAKGKCVAADAPPCAKSAKCVCE